MSSLELSIVASDFRPLASGVGRLTADVPPGIYQLVARAGPVVDRKLIRLEAGAVYSDTQVEVRFPAPAPVSDTSTSHEYQQDAAQEASQAAAQMAGPHSGLVIVLRDVRGYEGPPMEAADFASFDLLDQSLNPVPGFQQGWRLKSREAVAAWSGRLPPGGYALRTDPARAVGGTRQPAITQPFDQSLWLSANWQTIVFITTGPGGPRTSAASVHMTQLNVGWSPYETDVGLALELANWGLREGRSVVPDDLLNVLLGTKFVNPMLGIVGAHSMLLRQELDGNLLTIVLNNLDGMVPGHPDLLALRRMAALRPEVPGGGPSVGGGPFGQPRDGATWPPMLLPSYRALIALDAVDRSAIADGSPAERAAAHLLVQGIWTNWTPLPPAAPEPPAPVPPRGRRRQGIAPEGVLPALARDPALIEKVPSEDPATARVAGYLGALAALEGPTGRVKRFATLTREEIGLATTLPAASVDRALARISAAVAPTGGGGGGGGLIRASLPFVAAGALLLAGAIGAVAWCTGTDGCPLIPREPVATETPFVEDTPVPTETPTPTPQPTPTPSPTPTPEPTVTPGPIFLESALDFGPITIGGRPGALPLNVVAHGPTQLRFEFTQNPDNAFSVPFTCDLTATDTDLLDCSVVVTFTPPREGQHSGTLAMFAIDDGAPQTVDLVGEGVALFLRYPLEQEFPTVYIGDSPSSQILTISASEDVPVQFVVTEGATEAFSTDPTCIWAPGDSGLFECTFQVEFGPQSQGENVATLAILTTEPNLEPRTIRLFGFAHNQVD